MTDIKTLRRVLTDYKRVAVVGLSEDWSRPKTSKGKIQKFELRERARQL